MPTVVGVNFKPVTKIYYFDPGGIEDLQKDDYVVVETSQGREIGQVVWQPQELDDEEITGPLKPVVRRATSWDLVERDQNRNRQREALEICRTKAADLRLPMKVVGAEHSFDGRRMIVSFTADGRVDFRDLVRDLARIFRKRIEMRQIGVRDEAKELDGIGKCGQQLCCASWLRDFNPVSIKMAKQQNLPLNPAEISGVCGRLLCCLAYEMDTYADARRRLPKVGALVDTPSGRGRVRKVHSLRETVTVRLEDDSMEEFALEVLTAHKRSCAGCGVAPASSRSPDPDAAGTPSMSAPGDERSISDRPRSRRRRRKSGKPPSS